MSISTRNSNREPQFSKYLGIKSRVLRLEDQVSEISFYINSAPFLEPRGPNEPANIIGASVQVFLRLRKV